MDVDRIRELIALMKENELSEIRIVDGETRLLLRRGPLAESQPVVTVAPAPTEQPAPAAPPPAEDANLTPIPSPMVGTFYTAATPDSDPYVKVGDRVAADTVVCIVEAMKVMNEIKAEVSGTIEKIVAQNTQPVEYAEPLFMVRPD